MRISDSRYARERNQFELAMRMIAYEARTCTIRTCTGLSDDRIRKIYTTYFKAEPKIKVRRQRGKPPTRISVYVKSRLHQAEATTLGLLYADAGLILVRPDRRAELLLPQGTVEYGQRFCLAYDMYCLLHPGRRICFERAWFLIEALARGDELQFTRCELCQNIYIHDSLSLRQSLCPGCSSRTSKKSGRQKTA
ncbi:MAG: hypothetical protein KJO54_08425 [Gammaproteobacteria bacterium]|nr:hypothetical protein [Gammaproteobacteria bacterium]NNF60164.1 hypothetical protein [Gammaproteobacteria bacterium]NNM21577.1 hypothetical protein [Gammaproteobacteria bacterium]